MGVSARAKAILASRQAAPRGGELQYIPLREYDRSNRRADWNGNPRKHSQIFQLDTFRES